MTDGPTSMTLAERIIARAGGRERVAPGDVLWVDVDLAMITDSGGPRRIWPMLRETGGSVWDPQRLVVVSDHWVPAGSLDAAEILQVTRDFVAAFEIPRFHEAEGICHILMMEQGYAEPGMLFVGGDSHSPTAGALGCLAVGMGSTDMFGIVATGRTWLRVPATIQVVIGGELGPGVAAKDLILSIIGDRGMDGALYRVLEFGGSAIRAMSIEQRSVLTNMCAEIGAKSGIIPADEVTLAYLEERGVSVDTLDGFDADAAYEDRWEYDASAVEPCVARPHRHDDVVPIAEAAGARVTRAYVGACTGAKYSDLAMAAEVLSGRKVDPGVLLHVAPASRSALRRAVEDGTAQTLMDAGAHFLATGCGACPGIGNGVLGPGDVCISTTSRNARGRMGSPDAEVYLGSPYAVAAAAVAGAITDPRELLGGGP
jgi:3-isopropylmalate/(R)-2-methylmalate dehydratase large subunit